MGARRVKKLVTAVCILLLFILFQPERARGKSSELGAVLFKEAAISALHAESGRSLLSRDFASGVDEFQRCSPFRDENLVPWSLRRLERNFVTFQTEEEIEANMGEEEVAETPEDMLEEEDIPLPVDLNKRVEYSIKYFQTGASAHFKEWHRRFGKYEKLMRKILRSEGVPGDFVYLAMIESGFSPKAVSRAGAVGIWQFMYWTGKKYGLNIDWWDDERRDFEHSTRAAAKYLKNLYDMFGSWYLAAAAYNVGEGKIDRAIRRYRTNDYWKLVKYRYLPRETKNYVPKMLAALSIVKDPELYGFTDLEMDYPLTFDVIDLPGGIDLRTLAEIIEADYEEIKALNTGIRRGISPPYSPVYPVRIPFGSKEKATEKMQEIERRARVKFVLHRITSKDNISRIARKYASDVMRIKEVNGLRSNSIRSRKRLIVPIVGEPRNAYAASLKPVDDRTMRRVVASLERSARYYYVYKEGNKKIYLVKKGDSLYKISRRFGVSVSTLKRLNGLRGNMIRPGQKIAIRVYGKPAKGAQKTNRSSYTYRVSGGKKIYTVRQGNSLYSIARAFGISTKNLKKMNGLQGEMIRPGMKLIVGYTG